MEEIIIATSNKGKVREAQEILKKFKVIPMSEIGVNYRCWRRWKNI